MQNKRNSANPRIIVIPHYVGTEKAEAVIKRIISDEVKKKIEKSA